MLWIRIVTVHTLSGFTTYIDVYRHLYMFISRLAISSYTNFTFMQRKTFVKTRSISNICWGRVIRARKEVRCNVYCASFIVNYVIL